MIYGIGLPKTGTTTLKKALEILGVEAEVGDYVHFLPKWEGKLILTTRENCFKWYHSVRRWDDKNKMGAGILTQRRIMYGTPYPNKNWVNVYRHHERTCSKLPNCLVVCWENGDGWKELCEFLDVPIPDVPFPHLNKNH